MTDQGKPPTGNSPGASRGVFAEVMSLTGSFGRHAQALTALVQVESREAAGLWLRLTVILIAALIFAVFGYVLLLLFVAFLLATLFGIAWIWILLGFAILHLLVAFLCALHVKTNLRTPVFTSTAAELAKDFQSLKGARP